MLRLTRDRNVFAERAMMPTGDRPVLSNCLAVSRGPYGRRGRVDIKAENRQKTHLVKRIKRRTLTTPSAGRRRAYVSNDLTLRFYSMKPPRFAKSTPFHREKAGWSGIGVPI